MTRYNFQKDAHFGVANGDDAGAGAGLTAWRNADAAYVSGELKAADIFQGWYIKAPTYETERTGAMSTSRVSDRISMRRMAGEWRSIHDFQTCQYIWWLMQTAGTPTAEGTPTDYNTHTLTISAVSTPLWYGGHFEREGISSNELRYDMSGMLPQDLVINVGESPDAFKATQEITVPFAFLKRDASDIAAQTQRPAGTIGTKIKTWADAITGNGAGKVPSGLVYGASPAQLEVDVKHISIRLHRDIEFGAPDTTGYPTVGLMKDFDYSVVLDVVPTGDLLYTVNNTPKASYDGDLDYTFSFTSEATNDKITFTFDKMYLVPFDEDNDWNKYKEVYSITLEPLDTTSSLTVVGIDGLDNTYFENP